MKLVADQDAKVRDFRPTECNFCFIATPHLGANFTKLRAVAEIFPNGVLATIFGWNPEIEKINNDFIRISKPLVDGIVCFSERKKYSGVIKLIDRKSSDIEDPRALNLAISKSHSQICVVTTKSDVIYKSVLKLARNEKPGIHVGEAFVDIDQSIVDRLFQ